jgi:hypothetical protein
MPESETGKGKAVPFPYRDKGAYKASHTNKEINAAIKGASVEQVPLAGLHAIQHSVRADQVAWCIRHPRGVRGGARGPHGGPVDLPIVVEFEGVRYIHDGHHRLVALRLEGVRSARVRLVRLT